jgi:hypothetical protein
MRQVATAWDAGCRLVPLDGAAQILLLPGDPPVPPREAVRAVVAAARSVRPEARIQVVVGDRVAAGESLAAAAARLRRVARRTIRSASDEAVSARTHSLASLLETLDPRDAAAFVE